MLTESVVCFAHPNVYIQNHTVCWVAITPRPYGATAEKKRSFAGFADSMIDEIA